ncbi:hypothetical protein CGRA01v4_15050 [Colletotrichum graminicola]|nr:hypothetical protein CGRA01v4_15050 [Colletotrichum graminicola]
MATQMMVKNLSSADQKTLEIEIKTQRNALKRSKHKVNCIKELDSLWGSRDAWLPPRYRSKQHEIPGMNIVVSLRSITQKAIKLGVPLSSLWEDRGDLLEAAKLMSGNHPPILTARSAELANRDFFWHHSSAQAKQRAASRNEDSEMEDLPAQMCRHITAEQDPPSSPSPLWNHDNDDGGFRGALGGFADLGSDNDSDLGGEFQFNVADLSLGSLSVTDENQIPIPEATPSNAVIIEDDAGAFTIPTPDINVIDVTDTDLAVGPPGLHLLPSSVALFLRIQEQLSNNVCLHDDVLWYTLWSAMPSAGELAHQKIILIDPLLLSIDAWLPDGTGLKLPEILHRKLEQCTIYAPVHHRDSGHWTAVQVLVGASHVAVNHFDPLFSARRSVRVKRLLDMLLREACPGSTIEFVEAACPQQLDSVSCGVYTIGVIRRLIGGKCIPRHMDQEEERKSLLAMLPDHQALQNTFDHERGARLYLRKGRLGVRPISSISSDSEAFSLEATRVGKSLIAMAQRRTLVRLSSPGMAPTDSRPSLHPPAQTLDLVTHGRKRKRILSSDEDDDRPTKHAALTDWALGVSKQASAFACSDDVLEQTRCRLLYTRHKEAVSEARLHAAIARVHETKAAVEESNEKVAATEFLDAVQQAARKSATLIAQHSSNASQSKIAEAINATTVLLTSALRGTGPSAATSGEVHEELARAKEALQGAMGSATAEMRALQASAVRKRQDEVLVRQQEGLQLVRDGLAQIQSWSE